MRAKEKSTGSSSVGLGVHEANAGRMATPDAAGNHKQQGESAQPMVDAVGSTIIQGSMRTKQGHTNEPDEGRAADEADAVVQAAMRDKRARDSVTRSRGHLSSNDASPHGDEALECNTTQICSDAVVQQGPISLPDTCQVEEHVQIGSGGDVGSLSCGVEDNTVSSQGRVSFVVQEDGKVEVVLEAVSSLMCA